MQEAGCNALEEQELAWTHHSPLWGGVWGYAENVLKWVRRASRTGHHSVNAGSSPVSDARASRIAKRAEASNDGMEAYGSASENVTVLPEMNGLREFTSASQLALCLFQLFR